MLAAAVLPVAAANVADTVPERERSRAMAWMNLAIGLGIFSGPALSGLLTSPDWHFEWTYGHWVVDAFSVPFLTTAAAAALLVPLVLRWLPESRVGTAASATDRPPSKWTSVGKKLRGPLALVASSQFGMALYMTTFALYAGSHLDYGPRKVGYVFALCALVEAFSQGMIGPLSRWLDERTQVTIGFFLMGAGLVPLSMVETFLPVVASAAVLALGSGVISPNLLALITLGRQTDAGAALGLRGAGLSVGQFAGPVVGSGLFVWNPALPFLAAAILMLASAIWTAQQRT